MATLHSSERVSARIFVQLPGASTETLSEMLAIIRELVQGYPGVECVEGLTDSQVSTSLLQELLGPNFDELYYSHDSTGTICRQLVHAYPGARPICTGDAFGIVYPADFLAAYHMQKSIAATLKKWGKKFLGETSCAPITPSCAVLVLPVDPSGRGLRDIEWVCCPKNDFIKVVRRCHSNAGALRTYMNELLQRLRDRRVYMLLTETYAEAGHMASAHEISMYAEIIRKHCEHHSAIIVKPHPLDTVGKAARLRNLLGSDYDIFAVDSSFGRYPIEIWEEVVRACTVISTAYPVLSLKYIYDVDVMQPMDEAMVKRWIEPAYQKWSRESLTLYMEPLARLPTWDGSGVLWSGRP